jgi:Ca2+-binding EF-hand superfamily protein
MELNIELNELMLKTFTSIDSDNSGFIDMDELTNLSKQLGHELAEEELKVVFDELDENGDHKISFEEF